MDGRLAKVTDRLEALSDMMSGQPEALKGVQEAQNESMLR